MSVTIEKPNSLAARIVFTPARPCKFTESG
jgi:hypothetical protein